MAGGRQQRDRTVITASTLEREQAPDLLGVSEPATAPIAVPGLATSAVRRSGGSGGTGGDPLGGTTVDTATEAALTRPSGGRALDAGTRSTMESAFGADFGGVRVHTDSAASTLSRSLQATAFTHGSNIFFSEGTYRPGSEGGAHLLAHELTHVVQQQQGRGQGGASTAGTTVGRADDPLEAEAESTASTIVGALRAPSAHQDCDH